MSKAANNPTFEERLAQAKEEANGNMRDTRLKSDTAIDYELKKVSQSIIISALQGTYEMLGLDDEKLDFSIKMARRSEYGRISELITSLAKVYNWPIEDVSEIKEIDQLQEDILQYLQADHNITVTHDLLIDIKEAKGFHTFLARDTYELQEAQEPEYDELGFYLRTFAEYAGMPIIDYKLTYSTWSRNERKALAKVQTEQDAAELALAKHNELNIA